MHVGGDREAPVVRQFLAAVSRERAREVRREPLDLTAEVGGTRRFRAEPAGRGRPPEFLFDQPQQKQT